MSRGGPHDVGGYYGIKQMASSTCPQFIFACRGVSFELRNRPVLLKPRRLSGDPIRIGWPFPALDPPGPTSNLQNRLDAPSTRIPRIESPTSLHYNSAEPSSGDVGSTAYLGIKMARTLGCALLAALIRMRQRSYRLSPPKSTMPKAR